MRIFAFSVLGVLLSAGSAMAQYHPYSAPASLPIPTNAAPSSYYDDPQPVVQPQAQMHGDGQYMGGYQADAGWDGGYGGCSSCGSGGCGADWFGGFGNCGCDACGPNWYGRVGGLVMVRDDADQIWLDFNVNDVNSMLLGTPTAGNAWQGGFEVSAGHRLCNGNWIGGTYWTLDPDNQSATVSLPGGIINSTFDFRSLELNGSPVNAWFDNALAHRITLRTEIHSLELNLFGDTANCDPCSRHRFSWFGGARWFRFKDDFLFATSDASEAFGVDPANEAYWNVNVTNNLIGGQIGGTAEYALFRSLSVYATPSIGLYHNRITYDSSIRSGDALYTAYEIYSDKNDFAVLSQLDLGASYNVNSCLRAYFGYRLVAAAGVALSQEQIPYLADDFGNIRNIDTDGHLFLHGGFAGIEFRR